MKATAVDVLRILICLFLVEILGGCSSSIRFNYDPAQSAEKPARMRLTRQWVTFRPSGAALNRILSIDGMSLNEAQMEAVNEKYKWIELSAGLHVIEVGGGQFGPSDEALSAFRETGVAYNTEQDGLYVVGSQRFYYVGWKSDSPKTIEVTLSPSKSYEIFTTCAESVSLPSGLEGGGQQEISNAQWQVIVKEVD